MQKDCISISTLNRSIKLLLEDPSFLNDIWITGEITQFNHYKKGNHYYFNLTEGTATISCVMYSSFLPFISFFPKVGQTIFARGKIQFYQNKGSIMFQVAYMNTVGLGKHIQNLAALKDSLQKKGYFDPQNKQPIPLYPEKIGLITALDSLAMGDFITILRQSNRYSEVLVLPTTMQGKHAPMSLCESLDLATYHSVDVIAIVRGGGSAEELSVFNNETLCHHVFNSYIPIITGIGHQTDSSLCDLIADESAVTPTACAQTLNKPFSDIIQYIEKTLSEISSITQSKIESIYTILNDTNASYQSKIEAFFHASESHFRALSHHITSQNPLNALAKGYSVTSSSKNPLKSVAMLKKDDILLTRLSDGTITSSITDIIYEKKENN